MLVPFQATDAMIHLEQLIHSLYTLVTDANGDTDYTGTDWAIDGTTCRNSSRCRSSPDFDCYETSQMRLFSSRLVMEQHTDMLKIDIAAISTLKP